MARGAKKALPYWWERSLRDWKFPNYRLVLPEGEAKKTKAKKKKN